MRKVLRISKQVRGQPIKRNAFQSSCEVKFYAADHTFTYTAYVGFLEEH